MWRKCKDQLPDDDKMRFIIYMFNNYPFRKASYFNAKHKVWIDDEANMDDTVVAWWDEDLPSIPDEYHE